MSGFVTNGIIAKDTYGDWCVPPEDPKLIHSNDPTRKTDKALLATAYFYHDLRLMARYATMLGQSRTTRARFSELAEQAQDGVQREVPQPRTRASTTTARRPPACCRWRSAWCRTTSAQRVFDHLVRKITEETKGHIGTGLIGGQ